MAKPCTPTEEMIVKLRKAGQSVAEIAQAVSEGRGYVASVVGAMTGTVGKRPPHPSQVSQTPLKVMTAAGGPYPCSGCGLPHDSFVKDTDRVCLACHLRANMGHDRNSRKADVDGQGSRVGE